MVAKSLSKARAVKKKVAAMMADDPALAGVGISHEQDGYSVKLNLSHPGVAKVPDEIDGVPIRVHVVGRIRKQPA